MPLFKNSIFQKHFFCHLLNNKIHKKKGALTRPLFFCIVLVLLSPSIFAEGLLSFNQCVEITLKNNLEIRSADESLQANKFQTESSRGNYYPQVTGNLNYNQAGPQSSSLTFVSGTTYSATLGFSQNVFNGFSDQAKINQFQAQEKIAEANLEIIKAKVSFDLKSALANFLYTKELEKATNGFLKRREDNLKMVELRYASGRENKGSLFLAQAYLKQAQVDVLKSRHARENGLEILKKVLGFNNLETNDFSIFDFSGDVPVTLPSEVDPDFKNLVLATPEYKQFRYQVELSQASLESSKSGFFPSLNLTGSLGKTDDTFFPSHDRWNIGAQMTLPLFGGGKDYYSVKSASFNLYSAKTKLMTKERDSSVTLKKSYSAFVEAVADFQVSEAFLIAAKSRAEIAQAKYNNGLLTFDEWDIIENDLILKTRNYILARRDRIIAEATWDQTKGVGVFQ